MRSANLEAIRMIQKALADGDKSGNIQRFPLSKSFYSAENIQAATERFSDLCKAEVMADESFYFLTLQVKEKANSQKVIGEFLNALLMGVA